MELLEPIALLEARRACASLMVAVGVNPKALSVIMGHARIAMMFDAYGHPMLARLEAAAAQVITYLTRPGLRAV